MHDIFFSTWGGRIVDNRGKEPEDFEPTDHMELPEYFKEEEKIKALMGWGGLILRSPDVDIIDLCRAHLEAVHDQSKTCGKCNYCKTGFEELLEVLQDISDGEATEEDLEFMDTAAEAIIDSSKCSIGKLGPDPFRQALKYFADEFEKAVNGDRSVTTGAYHSKLTAPCMDACPIHLDIPKYIELIKDAKFGEALEVIRERLPMPGVVGRVCFRPCEKNCRRGNLDEPISIKSLKRFVADNELSKEETPDYRIAPSGKTGKAAIVGAGPAGLSCAYHLAMKGHEATIYESLGEPGGMAAIGIPDYRLPRGVLNREVEWIEQMGVTIKYNQTVGKEVTLADLENEFDAVFAGVGAQRSLSMGLEGEDSGCKGFLHGLEYLREINQGGDPYPDGEKVVVVGGGNVAVDCVRGALRLGKAKVHLMYRRTRDEMPADEAEIRDAEEEGIVFHHLTTPVRVIEENGRVAGLACIRMKLGEPDKSGRPRPEPVEDSEFVFDCDTVVLAIGQQVDLSFLEGMEDIETTEWRTTVVDEVTKQSGRPKVFFAGDCETGPDALITACAGGRRAAVSIDHLINDRLLEDNDNRYFDRFFKSIKVFDPNEEIRRVESKPRQEMPTLPPESRKSGFDEVEQGFSDAGAVAEAERCLRCYQVVTIAV